MSKLIANGFLLSFLSACGGGNETSVTSSSGAENTYVVSTSTTSGIGFVEPLSQTVINGSSINFKIRPASGYQIGQVVGCNGVLDGETYRVTNVSSTCNIAASFISIQEQYVISTSAGTSGHITPDSAVVNAGESIVFEVTPYRGFSVLKVDGCLGNLSGNKYLVKNIQSTCSINAEFTDLRQAPTQLTYKQVNANAELSWHPSLDSTGYRIYYSENPISNINNTGSDIKTIETKEPKSTMLLLKSYNHYFVKVAALYDATEVVSEEQLEIRQDYQPTGLINDTGITHCLTGQEQVANCSDDMPIRQDAITGRDAAAAAGKLSKSGTGIAGFDFSKVDVEGQLLINQQETWQHNGSEHANTQWSCVRDNHTGLIWEIKTDSGIRSKSNQFTWYLETLAFNGGNPGANTYEQCSQTICNTKDYIQYLNSIQLCGSRNWRLPTRSEKLSLIANNSTSPPNAASLFPDTAPNTSYWTVNSYMPDVHNAWGISINSGIVFWYPKTKPLHIRLVHSS